MKKIVILFLLFVSSISLLEAKDIKDNLPKLLSTSTLGKEFYFSFLPGYETSGANDLGLTVYVFSPFKSKVKLEVSAKGYEQVKDVLPNQIVEFTVPTTIGQPYKKAHTEPPNPIEFWKGAAMHLISDNPVVCYALSNFELSSDGFLVYPVQNLGRNYIVASYENITATSSENFPSYTAIIAPYDLTNVTFTMGGTEWSKSTAGLVPGETKDYKLNSGDVVLIGSIGTHAELTGSNVDATKPVALISGNYCAFIPSNGGWCDILEEMEMPTNSWGSHYHVTPVMGRKKNPMIKVFAKESNTKIFRDDQQIGFIKKSGGMKGIGYLDIRSIDGTAKPVMISGDKPISVTIFNPGRTDDDFASDPFQLAVIPVESYVKEAYFASPDCNGATNLLEINYQTDNNGLMPDDMEIGIWNETKFEWQKLNSYSSNPEIPYDQVGIGKFSTKTVSLPTGSIYKIRSSKTFSAYILPLSYKSSYAFQAFLSINDLTKNDTLAPVTQFTIAHGGNVNVDTAREVIDMPDDYANRSNLSLVYMHTDLSYNYKFFVDDFMPCEVNSAEWRLEIINNEEDAGAVLSFMDCAGNTLDTSLYYLAPKCKLTETIHDFGLVKIGDKARYKFYLHNFSETGIYELEGLMLKKNDQGFSLWDESGENPLQVPLIIQPMDSLGITVQFDAVSTGEFWDSLGYGDCCNFWYKAFVQAKVGAPQIVVSDLEFPPTKAGGCSVGEINVKNTGDVPLNIYDYKGPFLLDTNKSNKIYFSQDLIDKKICHSTPLIINSNKSITFEFRFEPDDSLAYADSIVFISNTGINENVDSVSKLSGKGVIPIDVFDDQKNGFHIYPNPANELLMIEFNNSNLQPNNFVEIYDILGNKLFYQKYEFTQAHQIDISFLQCGIYYIVLSNNNHIERKQFSIIR